MPVSAQTSFNTFYLLRLPARYSPPSGQRLSARYPRKSFFHHLRYSPPRTNQIHQVRFQVANFRWRFSFHMCRHHSLTHWLNTNPIILKKALQRAQPGCRQHSPTLLDLHLLRRAAMQRSTPESSRVQVGTDTPKHSRAFHVFACLEHGGTILQSAPLVRSFDQHAPGPLSSLNRRGRSACASLGMLETKRPYSQHELQARACRLERVK